MQDQKFEAWAIIELFGHSRMAGLVSEQSIAGSSMVRVDVPETENQPAFTRLLNVSAIYAINPVDKETALVMAKNLDKKPIETWDIQKVIQKQQVQLASGPNEGDKIDGLPF